MTNSAAQDSIRTYRLGWKGILYYPTWFPPDPGQPGCLALLLVVAFWLPGVFVSYLRTRAEGLEVRLWPFYRLQVAWPEVERLGKCKHYTLFPLYALLPCDALYLSRPAASAREAVVREWALAERCIVPLSDFQGWPDGALAEELRQRLPRLFRTG